MTKSPRIDPILSFALGASVGAAVALLFAPRAGEVLRDDIAKEIGSEVNQVLHAGKNLKRRAQKIAVQAHDQLQDAIAAGEEAHARAQKS
jgi:gas vesicle protein